MWEFYKDLLSLQFEIVVAYGRVQGLQEGSPCFVIIVDLKTEFSSGCACVKGCPT